MIREIEIKELDALTELHLIILPRSIQAKFGKRFVRFFYKTLISDPDFYCDGFFWNSQMVGYVAYSPIPWKVFRRVLRKKIFSYIIVLFLSILRRPARLSLIMKVSIILFRLRPEPAKKEEAEAINWGVLPEYRRSSAFFKETGVHVAMEIHQHMVKVMKAMNVKRIKIMPNAGDPATVNFLQKDNWKYEGKINRWGELLDVFTKEI